MNLKLGLLEYINYIIWEINKINHNIKKKGEQKTLLCKIVMIKFNYQLT